MAVQYDMSRAAGAHGLQGEQYGTTVSHEGCGSTAGYKRRDSIASFVQHSRNRAVWQYNGMLEARQYSLT